MKKQKDFSARIALICTGLLLLTAACASDSHLKDDVEEEYALANKDGMIECTCDITNDGNDDKICIKYGDAMNDEQALITVWVETGSGDAIWRTELALPHMGWSEYYITTVNGKCYLIHYIPEGESQGLISYYIKVFSLDSIGHEHIVLEGSAESTAEIEQLKTSADQYLEHAVLLVSTMGGELDYWGKGLSGN